VIVADPIAIKYRAFLSYSHRDQAWGEWLHKALEGTHIDKDLVGQQTPAGPVPKTLRPVFRDREDFAAGHSLTEQTLAALAASQFLIVLCSPNAAKSIYVNEEIRRFKALGRADRVIPVIVGGEPGNPDLECFPAALRYRVGPDGALTDEREEPIAADARPQGDGKAIATLKVVAGLLGIGLDQIVRRAERHQKRRARIRNGIIAMLVALTLASAGGFAWARYELSRNEALLDRMLQRATALTDKAVALSKKYGVPRAVSVGFLDEAEGLFHDMAELSRETPQLRFRKAWMLIEFARNYEMLGETEKQRARAADAIHLLTGLAAERPDDLAYQQGIGTAHNELGLVLMTQGHLDEALVEFSESLGIRQRLAQADPNNAVWQRDLSVVHNNIGDQQFDQGRLPEALISYRESLAIRDRLAKAVPGNLQAQLDLGAIHGRVGDVYKAQREYAQALIEYEVARAIFAALDSNYAEGQRELVISLFQISQTFQLQSNLIDATKFAREALALAESLTRSDPYNAYWQRDLSAVLGHLGGMLRAQGNLPDAMKVFRDDLEISRRLAKADPSNTLVQRTLSVALDSVGTMLQALG
jgi:eukaryotic-like serine/threonine-protein kinase